MWPSRRKTFVIVMRRGWKSRSRTADQSSGDGHGGARQSAQCVRGDHMLAVGMALDVEVEAAAVGLALFHRHTLRVVGCDTASEGEGQATGLVERRAVVDRYVDVYAAGSTHLTNDRTSRASRRSRSARPAGRTRSTPAASKSPGDRGRRRAGRAGPLSRHFIGGDVRRHRVLGRRHRPPELGLATLTASGRVRGGSRGGRRVARRGSAGYPVVGFVDVPTGPVTGVWPCAVR